MDEPKNLKSKTGEDIKKLDLVIFDKTETEFKLTM
jgi:hypothetical protein